MRESEERLRLLGRAQMNWSQEDKKRDEYYKPNPGSDSQKHGFGVKRQNSNCRKPSADQVSRVIQNEYEWDVHLEEFLMVMWVWNTRSRYEGGKKANSAT